MHIAQDYIIQKIIMLTQEQVQKVLKQYPTLSYFGFGLYEEKSRKRKGELNQEKYNQELKESQQNLFENIEEIELVMNLLEGIEKIKTFNKLHSSYGLKHWVENIYSKMNKGRYIANGSFIVGAILSGFEVKISQPNTYFNISEKSFKQFNKSMNISM